MNFAEIKNCDIANGPGVRVSLFVSGCTHHCPGCFNSIAWDFSYGKPFTEETESSIIEMLRPGYIRGLTLLGGEPFEPENQKALLPFIKRVRRELPEKSIWAYTGYIFERDLLSGRVCGSAVTMPILRCLDVLVDGPFIEHQKNLNLRFRGSENQRIIDVALSLRNDTTVLWKDWQEEAYADLSKKS